MFIDAFEVNKCLKTSVLKAKGNISYGKQLKCFQLLQNSFSIKVT